MTESEKLKASSEPDIFPQSAAGPLVFISHDGPDAELAEAFSKLLNDAETATGAGGERMMLGRFLLQSRSVRHLFRERGHYRLPFFANGRGQ